MFSPTAFVQRVQRVPAKGKVYTFVREALSSPVFPCCRQATAIGLAIKNKNAACTPVDHDNSSVVSQHTCTARSITTPCLPLSIMTSWMAVALCWACSGRRGSRASRVRPGLGKCDAHWAGGLCSDALIKRTVTWSAVVTLEVVISGMVSSCV